MQQTWIGGRGAQNYQHNHLRVMCTIKETYKGETISYSYTIYIAMISLANVWNDNMIEHKKDSTNVWYRVPNCTYIIVLSLLMLTVLININKVDICIYKL